MKVSHIGPAIISVALLSCAAPTENEPPLVEFRTDRTAYVMGESGVLTLTNRGTHAINVDWACSYEIQRMVGTSWESVDTGVWCLPEEPQQQLAPGASEVLQFQVVAPAFASAGEYRFQVAAWYIGSRQSLVISSDPFTVEN